MFVRISVKYEDSYFVYDVLFCKLVHNLYYSLCKYDELKLDIGHLRV